MRSMLAGAAAGAAGTTALNAVGYADMVWRGRAASHVPEETVEALAERAHVSVPGDGDAREHRLAGLGALSGILTGVGIGALVGSVHGRGARPPGVLGAALAGAAAMAATDGTMAAVKVTDPRKWSFEAWVSDVLPHLAYGAVTYAVLTVLDRRPSR
ncbi:hypothetical protein KZZ52_24005 [Dactylosporangium sp. AC04546]|uniref:hypothetical protein n=1 Tax=Dactylosporangium sp. AC04546 TaxID=2862460 RepID=UPI001EDE3FDB|nr:hypothetical protein [Dactylosporangium sp. AC04546]WVK88340.1 hypothetical protein KZZ52_24005 [Dactylosporangium sp. AC04546]